MTAAQENVMDKVGKSMKGFGDGVLGMFGGKRDLDRNSSATPPASPDKKFTKANVPAPGINPDVDSEFKRPFTTSGPSSPPKKAEDDDDAEAFNEFNFWKQAQPSLLAKMGPADEKFNEYNFWKNAPPSLEQLESMAPSSPSKSPASLKY